MEYLSKEFKNVVPEDLNIYEFGEGLPLDKYWGILVPYVSAIRLSNNNHYKIEDADHLTICKPPNKDHPSYFLLLKCLRLCMKKNIELPPLPKYLVHDLNPTCNSNNPNLTIIFFHGTVFGTNDDWKETWTTWTTCPTNNRKEYICWLEKWLPEDLNNNVRILSLAYNLNIMTNVHNDVIGIGQKLIQSLVINSSYQSLWDGPVALVAYSFGGFVLKSLMVEAHKHVNQRPKNGLDDEVHKCCKTFLNNVKGVIFYGVPHFDGTQKLLEYFNWQCEQNSTFNKYSTQPDFSKNLKHFNQQMEYLSIDFKNAVPEDLNIYAFSEGLPLNEYWGILVPYASTIRFSNNNHYKIDDANHLTICKPSNKDHPSYFLLLKCLRICMKKNILLPPLPCHEVALIDKAQDINMLLQKESIVGLVGMGGIGKTTLSNKFYHLFHNQYDKSSFLEDVDSMDNINDVIKQLLHDLCGKRLYKDENVNKEDFDEIKQCMISKKVLVVVDNVGKVVEKLKGISLKKCVNLPLLSQIDSKGFCNLRLVDLTQASPTIVKNFIQGRNLNNVKWLCLKKCMIQKLPSNLFYCLQLQVLDLAQCQSLEEIPSSIGQLNALQELDLSGCSNLKELPSSIGQLNALQELDLQRCSNLKELPSSIGQLNALEELDLRGCSELKKIPSSIGQLNALQKLNLSWCSNLKELPSSIGQLNALQELDLQGCSELKELPSTIGQLNALQKFNLSECSNLKELPSSIGQLNPLQKFNLSECFNLKYIPSFIGQLNALQELDLSECCNFKELPSSIGDLNVLQKLNLSGCSYLKELPSSISQLNALQKFYLSRCSKLKELPLSIGQLNVLQELYLSKCSNFKTLPSSIGQLNALQELDLSECSNLKYLPSSIGQLNALQELDLSWCSHLNELPSSIGHLNALQKLNLSRCSNLEELPSSIGQLNALQELNLSGCSNLKYLPSSIGDLNALQGLYLLGCSNLKELPSSISQLNALKGF